jgi:hypothetical protein
MGQECSLVEASSYLGIDSSRAVKGCAFTTYEESTLQRYTQGQASDRI